MRLCAGILSAADPWAALDGRLGAPSGVSPAFSTVLDAYGANRPPWQVAGVDYGVGPAAGTVFKDPAVESAPAGVSFNTGTKVATVTGDDVTLDAWNFEGWQIQQQGDNFTFTNYKLKVLSEEGNTPIFVTGTNTTIRYGQIDGNSFTTTLGPLVDYRGLGTLTFEYNYLHHVHGDHFSITGDSPSDSAIVVIRFNVLFNNFGGDGAHPDIIQAGTASYDWTIEFNLVMIVDVATGSQGFVLENSTAIQVNYNTGVFTGVALQLSQFVNFDANGAGANPKQCTFNYVDLSSAGQFSQNGAGASFSDNVDMVDGEVFGEEPVD